MKKSQLIQDLVQVSLMAAVITFALPELSMAAGTSGGGGGADLGTTAKALSQNQLKYLPNLITAVCYVMGIFMMVAGALKLRAYTENPAQNPLRDGLGKLFVGGGVAALPSLTGWINQSTMVSGTSLSNGSFTVNFAD